jgi:hypothetical protein
MPKTRPASREPSPATTLRRLIPASRIHGLKTGTDAANGLRTDFGPAKHDEWNTTPFGLCVAIVSCPSAQVFSIKAHNE